MGLISPIPQWYLWVLYPSIAALMCYLTSSVIEIAVKAYLFLSQGLMEVLNPSYGLSIPKGNTPMIYAHLA